MHTWQMQEARGKLKDLYDAVLESGPQRITRHGKRPVVVVSEEEWNRRTGAGPSFGELLSNCPAAEEDLPPRGTARAIRQGTFD